MGCTLLEMVPKGFFRRLGHLMVFKAVPLSVLDFLNDYLLCLSYTDTSLGRLSEHTR